MIQFSRVLIMDLFKIFWLFSLQLLIKKSSQGTRHQLPRYLEPYFVEIFTRLARCYN